MSPPAAQVPAPLDPPAVPAWLRGLPRAPEYRPTESEFADPIAFLSRVEREAAAYGICKVIPPYPRPSRRFVFAHINRSLAASSDAPNPATSDSANAASEPAASAAVFTTRHQELGTPRRGRPPPQVLKQVWQSGERYTLDQFEAKSRAFSKTHLSGLREPTPLAVESLFWKASADRPIYIEYANDVPGSGFAAPPHSRHQKKRKREGVLIDEGEKTAGWRLSSSPWNLQAIARAPGSLTRFMPDDVPGVTSPMVYIGMLFSWFAWHVEDHELHSLNFLHTGAPKTWYAVPGDRAAELEEVIRVHGYGDNPDRLASLAVLGEKTTLMSPEVLVACGLPCCRLVQYPGEFVVTFPRAYHVGFSHGFNCGEAANFATPQWLKFAKEAAVRRAVMNYLPMLSHQQLLYLLAVSFISRTPRELFSGIRTSRLRDRKKEERELLVKQEFLQDMISENELLCSFLNKKSIENVVLWEPDLLPSTVLHPCSSGSKAHEKKSDDARRIEYTKCSSNDNSSSDGTACTIVPKSMSTDNKSSDATFDSKEEKLDTDVDDEVDLPFDLSIDSGSLTCVACGILGYPFMAILQPSRKALEELSLIDRERFKLNFENENHSNVIPHTLNKGNSGCPFIVNRPSSPVEHAIKFSHDDMKSHEDCALLIAKELDEPVQQYSGGSHSCSCDNTLCPCINTEATGSKISSDCFGTELIKKIGSSGMDAQSIEGCMDTTNWNTRCTFARPRIFCLQHALEIEKLLEGKGGARALIICHSDYVKLKALAISIAEEIEFQFDFKDVSLANASKTDLHIINISIDDEEHEENGRDWTSQMCLNLKYCARLRKETPGIQKQSPLSFWKLFSKPSPITVVPNLKWLCRKARTPYKVVGHVSSSNATATPEEVDPAVPKTNISLKTSGNADDYGEGQKTYQQGGLQQPSKLQESDDISDMCMSSEENEQDPPCLFDIPIALAEYPMMHQVREVPVCVSTCDGSACSLNFQDSSPLAATSADFSIEQRDAQSAELSSSSTFSVQQFLDNENISEEDSTNCISKHEILDAHKQLHDQENMVLSDDPVTHLVDPCPIKGKVISESYCATISATLENEENRAGTSHYSDTILENNNAMIDDKPEARGPGSALVGPKAGSGENGNSVYTESNSFDILLGVLAEESKVADAPGKDEVGNASLTLMTLASNDHSSDNVTEGEVVEMAVADKLLANQNSEIQRKGQTIMLGSSASCVAATFCLARTGKISGVPKKNQCVNRPHDFHVSDILSRSIGSSNRTDIICYVRRKHKRKRRSELNTNRSQSSGSFVRSPCESLRPRTRPAVLEEAPKKNTVESSGAEKRKRADVGSFQCDIEFCDMAFETRAELRAHQRNICTDESCGKRFSSHKYLKRHQCVHSDERPFKCPWDGCGMTFKWLWAQTEHVRVHTGERPYKCSVPDCGRRFRYVSDYSRHRKKYNHY